MEDLKVTKFSNGDPINQITGNNNYNGSICTSPGYVEHSNIIYYNGYTINDSRNVCPTGWSVPTILDFEYILNLFNELTPSNNNSGTAYGQEWDNAGKALKSLEASPNGGRFWQNTNLLNNNNSHLSFLLHNEATCTNSNSNAGNDPSYWSSTDSPWNSPSKWVVRLQNGSDLVKIYDWGYVSTSTTRCIKD